MTTRDPLPLRDADCPHPRFAGRHRQHEMFQAGAPFVAKGYAYRDYGYDHAAQAADKFLADYELAAARPGR